MEMSTKAKIGNSLWIAFTLFVGVFTIIFTSLDFEKSVDFIGIFLLVEALPHIFQTYKAREHKILVGFLLGLFVVGLGLAIWAFTSKTLTVRTFCTIYGIYGIARGIYIVISGTFLINIKNSKLPIVDIVLGIGDIVFGIILIIRGQAAVPGHLYFLGASFLVMCIMETIDYMYEK